MHDYLFDKVVPFVGRNRELDQLRNVLSLANRGKMQTVFLTGEAGIGKTRLAQEFTQRAIRHGWQVWLGRADAIGHGLAFSALIQAFRMAITALPTVKQQKIATLYPYINVFFPELGGTVPQPSIESGLERTQLFESLRLVAVYLAADRPAILWIDDLPDADPDTIEWLHYFLRHAERGTILFLGTCRTPVVNPAAGYSQLYSTLLRYHQLQEIHVQPLNTIESESLVRSVVPGDVRRDVFQLVQERSVGVPLFMIELLRMLAERGSLYQDQGEWDVKSGTAIGVPNVIASVIAERIKQLPAMEQEILTLIAVNEASAPWKVLQSATGLAPDALASALAHMVQVAVLVETSQSWEIDYGFSHPMIKEAIYTAISATALRQVHKRLADAWGDDIVRAAFHIRASGSLADVAEAVRVFSQAGEHYLFLRAYPSAAEYFEQALQLAEKLPVALSDEGRHEIQMALSEAWTYMERAPEALNLLAKLYKDEASTALKIRVKRLMAWVVGTRSIEQSIHHIEDGLQCWDEHSQNGDVLWMLNQQVFNFLNVGNLTRARQALTTLQQYCHAYSSPRTDLICVIREAHVALHDWSADAGKRLDADALLVHARDFDDPELAYDAYVLLGYYAINQGDYETAVRYAEEGVALVRRYGMVIHEISVRLMGMCGTLLSGNWKQALIEAGLTERLSRKYSVHVAVACVLDFQALLFVHQGKSAKARAATKESVEVMQRAISQGMYSSEIHPMSAARAAEVLLKDSGSTQLEYPVTVVWANTHGLPIFLKMLEGQLRIRSGNTEELPRLIQQLRQGARGEDNYFKAVADYLEGLFAKQNGDSISALQYLRNAIAIFDALETSFEGALARLEWVKIIARDDGREADTEAREAREAESEARRCLATFRKLGARPYCGVTEELLKTIQAALRLQSNRESMPQLTGREQQIVECVARGLSNKQIAEQLMVSPRTVSTHLDKLYRKLNVHSRTALVRKRDENE